MGKLKKKTVATHAWEPGVERDLAPRSAVCVPAGVHGVDVQVRKISFAQHHEVPQSSEVGLKIENFLPPTSYPEDQHGFGAGRHDPGV